MCSPILALKRLVAGVPGGVGEASHSSSISVSCEERGDAEGGEEMGRMATHLAINFCPQTKNEARETIHLPHPSIIDMLVLSMSSSSSSRTGAGIAFNLPTISFTFVKPVLDETGLALDRGKRGGESGRWFCSGGEPARKKEVMYELVSVDGAGAFADLNSEMM
jgi:hypothetical protein